MKTRIKALIVAVALVFGLTALTCKADDLKGTVDCVMMKDGKMMVVKGGQAAAMSKDTTLTDGTIVMMNGNVMMKDGQKMMMKDGQMMGMDGKMLNSDNMPGIHKD